MKIGTAGFSQTRIYPNTTFRLLRKLVLFCLIWCALWILFSTQEIQRLEDGRTKARHPHHRTASAFHIPPLTAYVEPFYLYDYSTSKKKLSLRSHGPDKLLRFTYPSVQSCDDIPEKLPVFHRADQDFLYGPNVRNKQSLIDESTTIDYAASTCPVLADPFLPWIHDFFPSDDGKKIEFVAHNRRRCNTDPANFMEEMRHLEPQVALMQPVPVTRISEDDARLLVPKAMWSDSNSVRYRLAASFSESTAKETRFICQFYQLANTVAEDEEIFQKQVIAETFSEYPYNYELDNARKPGSKTMLTAPIGDKDIHGAHNEKVWNSVLHFSCPVPEDLQSRVATGKTVEDGNRPTLFLDLVPIRTKPRRGADTFYPQDNSGSSKFDPMMAWGESHVLPEIKSSGRWSHIPICLPPQLSALRRRKKQNEQKLAVEQRNDGDKSLSAPLEKEASTIPREKHFLIGCIWASASFTTRSDSSIDNSTSDRLLEWLTYHIELAGFDHIYLYDNSGAHNTETGASLEPVARLFPDSVTRIPWSHRVCNNNQPSNANAGERSSQYAAETSCRVRHGPSAEWAIFFDTDEYLIPQGKWTSIRHWLKEGVDDQAENYILSFYQSRAKPNLAFMDPSTCNKERYPDDRQCLSKRSNITYMQAYDCESEPLPKDSAKWRAMKQLYRPWFVLNHFVHYSTVTKRILDFPDQVSPAFLQRAPYERRVNELTEAFMLHTKTTSPEQTRGWKQYCSASNNTNKKKSCPIGISFPLDNTLVRNGNVTDDGMKYNCYQHQRVQDFAPRLDEAIQRVRERSG